MRLQFDIMVNLPDQISSKLRSWQIAPAEHLVELLRSGQSCLDMSDTGTGKSYVACAVAAALGENTLAVVPKIAVSMWHRVAEEFGAPIQAIGYEALRTGQTNFGCWEHQRQKAEEHFVCMNCLCVVDFDDYRPCFCVPGGFHCIKTKKKPHRYGKFIWASEVKLILADEIHRMSALDSLNSDMLLAAKRQGIRVLGLSATAACSPLHMRALGYVLGLHNDRHDILGAQTCVKGVGCRRDIFPSFGRWASRYGVRPDPVHHYLKWEVSAARQVEVMKEIHDVIIPSRGVRVRTEDIPDFPERQILPQLYDIPNPEEIDTAYAEMENVLRRIDDIHPLTTILRARQRAEFSKVEILVELATDEMAKGNSCAIFICFRATLDELRKRLRCNCFVDGSTEGTVGRDAAISAFQANAEKLIILNNAAGGVSISLQDLHGVPRVALVSPSFSATEFRQVCGRLHRAGGKSKCLYRIVLAANTVEEKIFRALKQKESNLDALCDGDLTPV